MRRVFFTAAMVVLPATASSQGADLRLAEATRVGPPTHEFGAISDVALDATGSLWIADGMSGEVHVVINGVLSRVAGPGQGPGELTPGPLELVVMPGDTILVVEPHAARLSHFAPGGAFIRTVRLASVEGLTSDWRQGADGELLAQVNVQTLRRPGVSPQEGGNPIVAFNAEGERLRSVATLSAGESFRMGPAGVPAITLLGAQPVWTVDSDGRVLTARTDSFRVAAVAGDGSAVTLVNDGVDSQPINGELEQKARELLRETMSARRMPPQAVEQLVGAAGVAERAPVLGGLLAGPDGSVWVREGARTAADLIDLEQPGGRTWRIFSRTGQPRGSITLPSGFKPVEWRGDQLAGIVVDDVGRTSAVVLQR